MVDKIILTYSYPIPSNELLHMKKKFPFVEFVDISKPFFSETELFSSGCQEGLSKDISGKSNLTAYLNNASIYYGEELPENLLLRAPELRWIQYASDGLNVDVTQDILNSNILFTNARGIAAFDLGSRQTVAARFEQRQNRFWKTRSQHSLACGAVTMQYRAG